MLRLLRDTVKLSTPTRKWSLGRLNSSCRNVTSTSGRESAKTLTYLDSVFRLFDITPDMFFF